MKQTNYQQKSNKILAIDHKVFVLYICEGTYIPTRSNMKLKPKI